jgi:curli production assembly/transport component CsgF
MRKQAANIFNEIASKAVIVPVLASGAFCFLRLISNVRGDFAMFSRGFYVSFLLIALSTPAMADMIYKPINPSFGGDSFNSSHLQGLAGSQNEYKNSASSAQQSNSERFLNMLESRLYSSLASQVAEAIFGENAQPNGTITFDDQTISFVNDGTQITLNVTDLNTGQITTISIPVLQ